MMYSRRSVKISECVMTVELWYASAACFAVAQPPALARAMRPATSMIGPSRQSETTAARSQPSRAPWPRDQRGVADVKEMPRACGAFSLVLQWFSPDAVRFSAQWDTSHHPWCLCDQAQFPRLSGSRSGGRACIVAAMSCQRPGHFNVPGVLPIQ